MNNSLFFFQKSTKIPTLPEIVYILRNFPFRKKMFFFVLAAVFAISALLLIWEINNYYLIEIPADGGALSEGIVGTPRFINPILAISDADRDMTSLIYSGLMRPDNKGGIVNDMAEKYEVSEDELVYTFTLKPDLEWHDGQPVTSDDIIFTIETAKIPAIKSPRRANWEGVEIEKIDERSIRFILKKPYTPFLENVVMGILPKHIWQGALPEQISFSEFNTEPIGSGPYKIKKINRNSSGIVYSYELTPNEKFILGKPHISSLTLKFYPSDKELLSAYQKGDIDNISAISPKDAEELEKEGSKITTLYLPRVFGVFLNQNNAKIFTHEEVRKALNLATDKEKIINEVLHGFGVALDYALPRGTLSSLSAITAGNGADATKAKELLEKNGWVFNEEEKVFEKIVKEKNAKEALRLEFSLSTSDSPELKQTAELLKSMWEEMGAKVNVKIFEIGDLNQNIIRQRKYDALLFGEIIGRDPDPFAFWHSSQRNDPGLNIAMYANIKVDKLLEDARGILDEKTRIEKYEEFQKEVSKDAPAIFLYSPRFIYIMPNFLKGFEEAESITVPSERFSQIHKWYIKTYKVWKIFAKEEN